MSKFEKAVDIVKKLPPTGAVKPTQEDQLYFYSYFKQATVGDVNVARPGMLDFTGKAKWDAWKGVEGTSKEDAEAKYVAKLLTLLKASGSEEYKDEIAELEA
ncbi:acyl-CoA-binding protein [Cylindrobasidium torrendii FP15055 ss-10]|uniref:Acyl-CoA-binding protein n=1 Tax=Cylindrobasidium torrendii FP15055 ss-10 TaxID=1314674 RepID=A0A0D7BEX2_9AGAR|nr:acyl-CoA-binding protein [Cylindrobasidium torrendii FP15055 ss-10]